MTNPVSFRLGRKRGDYAARADKKHQRQVANRLVIETKDWRADLGRSWLDLNPDDAFEEAYISGEHSK